jgi:Protein of unknown function (DUF1566)
MLGKTLPAKPTAPPADAAKGTTAGVAKPLPDTTSDEIVNCQYGDGSAREVTFYNCIRVGGKPTVTGSILGTTIQWAPSSSPTMMSLGAAVEYCRDLKADGLTDWRLPSDKELRSIINQALVEEDPNSIAKPLYEPFRGHLSSGYIFSSTLVKDDQPYIMNVAYP